MIKEPKNIDFATTGREPSAKDFARISEWIKKHKKSSPAVGKGVSKTAKPVRQKSKA